jgi:hypothetical protein
MANWTTLPNSAVGVGGLPSGSTVTALRDNPIAIAEGAAGAPRVELPAIVDALASMQLGGLGSYAFLQRQGADVAPGQVLSGGSLRYANSFGEPITTPTPSGTWRAMGWTRFSSQAWATVWLRIT